MMVMDGPWRPRAMVAIAGVVVLLLLAPGAVFGESAFIGRWAVESFGQEEDLVFQFTSDTEMLMSVGEETSPAQAYEVDTTRKLLTLPTADDGTIVLLYSWVSDDVFVLFMTEELLAQMVEAFTASLPNDANDLTDEIIEQLRLAVRGVFSANPFMRATRLE